MRASSLTRFVVMAGMLTTTLTLCWTGAEAAAAAVTAVRDASLHNANDGDLHADDSKISRIQSAGDVFADGNPIHQHQPAAATSRSGVTHRQRSTHRSRAHAAAMANNQQHAGGRKLTNQEVLRSLGLAKLNVPSSHQRKRLAVESRHHSRPDDSHMYIIKLPPHPVYYTKTSGHERNSITDTKKKVTVDFMSNGKPGRIYHWNLPVLKHMLSHEGGGHGSPSGRTASNSRLTNDIAELIDIRHIPTWTQPWENDTADKTYRRKNDRVSVDGMLNDSEMSGSVGYQHKSPTYYAPRPKKHSTASARTAVDVGKSPLYSGGLQQKFFPGNGKPKSFYVIKGKSQTPHYQKLIP